MIQDRLTAKFLNAKLATRRTLKSPTRTAQKSKAEKPSAIGLYSRGRQLPSSVWM